MRYWQAAKEKFLSIGIYPKVSLGDARKRRDELRKQLEANLDPFAERKATNRCLGSGKDDFEGSCFQRNIVTDVQGRSIHLKSRSGTNLS
jgi:hypothetical protein